MFTGLIEQQGEVIANHQDTAQNKLVIKACFKDIQAGESIAVNGVCLTVLPDFTDKLFFDVSPETIRCTTLGTLAPGDWVNLERALLPSMRIGGHWVQGHVDTTAIIQNLVQIEDCWELSLQGLSSSDMHYLIPKGSVTLDGISLTINTLTSDGVKIMIIPHTMANTTLAKRAIGDRMNVEFDYLTRIVVHQFTRGRDILPTLKGLPNKSKRGRIASRGKAIKRPANYDSIEVKS